MLYIFIFLFAIATIVVYVLQKNDEQKHTLKEGHGEHPAHLDVGATLEREQQADVPIPPKMSPQGISQMEHQTETSTARHLSAQADATETPQDDTSSDRDLTPTDSSNMEQQETTPASRKLTPREIVMIFAGALSVLIAFILMEMDHPLGPVLIGMLVLSYIVWFIRMPKEQWAQLKAVAKEAEEREARSPFRKALKVIGVSIVIVIILVILIEFFGKYL